MVHFHESFSIAISIGEVTKKQLLYPVLFKTGHDLAKFLEYQVAFSGAGLKLVIAITVLVHLLQSSLLSDRRGDARGIT